MNYYLITQKDVFLFIKGSLFTLLGSIFFLSLTTARAWADPSIDSSTNRINQVIATEHYFSMQVECLQKHTKFCQNITNPSKTENYLATIQTIVETKVQLKFNQNERKTIATFFERDYYTPLVHNASPKFTTFILLNTVLPSITESDLLEAFDNDTQKVKEYYLAIDFVRTSTGKKFPQLYVDKELFRLVKKNLSTLTI